MRGPVRGRTGQAGLLPSARPGGCTPGTHKNFYPPSGLWPCGADVRQCPAQARASARRSRARIDSGGTPPVRGRTGQFAERAHWRAGSYRDVTSRAREGPFAAGKKPERSQRSQWRGRVLSSRSSAALSRRSVAGLAKPPFCVPQRREGLKKFIGADASQRIDQARRKPPLRGAKRQREHPPRDGKEKDLTDENLLCYTGSTSKKRFFFCACFSEGGRGENAPKIFP